MPLQSSHVLFESDMALVRLMTMEPREVGQNHFHSHVFETIICTEGKMALHSSDGSAVQLSPGQQASISSPQTHYVENLGDQVARYLLLQTGGAYDFMRVSPDIVDPSSD